METSMEILKRIYGALKVDYMHKEGKRYYVYGFKNDEKEWAYDKGELIIVTDSYEQIELYKKNIFTIEPGKLFCLSCFKQKKVHQLKTEDTKFWIYHVWSGLPKAALVKLQNNLLANCKILNWSNVKSLTEREEPFIFYGVCSTCINNSNELDESEYGINPETIDHIVEQIAAEYVFNNNEAVLEHYIADHIELIEEDMTLIERQKKVDCGVIDILAKDSNDNLCVIELKTIGNDKNIVWQSAYYQAEFGENVRVITIAPEYSPSIFKALKNVRNTELKIYYLNNEGTLRIKDFEFEGQNKLIDRNGLIMDEEAAG